MKKFLIQSSATGMWGQGAKREQDENEDLLTD